MRFETMSATKHDIFKDHTQHSSRAENFQVQFQALLQKSRGLHLTPDQLSTLPSIDELRRATSGSTILSHLTQSTGIYCCRLLVVLLKLSVCILLFTAALVGFVVIAEFPLTRAEFTSFIVESEFVQTFVSEPCLLAGLDSPLTSLVRPPVDCSICRGLKSVDRVSKLSRDVFESRYAYSGRPVIVTDAMSNWSAVGTFSFEFFRGIYADDSPVLTGDLQRCQFFPYQTSFQNLSEVFSMSSDRAHMRSGSDPWYIGWSNCDGSAANVLRSYYGRPYFLPEEAESSKTDWIFMGSPGYGAHMHIDNVFNPSWQAQVSGTKLWTLEPPPECYFDCEASIETEVHPGEMIVIDTNQWFHSTLIVGSEMSITIGSEYD